MPIPDARETDVVLAPNEYIFISDQSSGKFKIAVGPSTTSLAGTENPVYYNRDSRRFLKCNSRDAIQLFPFADENSYVVLQNPACEGEKPHPNDKVNDIARLKYGSRININGPTTFALWPGQVADVIQGHQLRSNQYLIVKVYNGEEAKKNWDAAVIRPADPTPDTIIPDAASEASSLGEEIKELGNEQETESSESQASEDEIKSADSIPDLVTGKLLVIVTGKLLVIKGSEVSFYIPPTGIEVVPDKDGMYVRNAVTLERLEYCILLDESGDKRYVRGPAVVFPKPTEVFVEKSGVRKFRAIELSEISGVYIKVIAPYKEGVREYKEGQELFITGKDQMIYFPREEHALIKYDDKEIHHAIAIPAGEARYVMDRLQGKISLKKGPCMFLPDPRSEVVVKKILEEKMLRLMYPGNSDALNHNANLRRLKKSIATDDAYARGFERKKKGFTSNVMASALSSDMYMESSFEPEEVASFAAGDEVNRKTSYTPPRTLTLNTKYDGAVTVNVWTGYAIQVVSKSGQRRVVVGPQTVLLEYDESLEVVELSTGTPKTDEAPIKTVYLRVKNNQVSDRVQAETKDLVDVQIEVSYKCDFEDAPEKWFNVENYVKFLTDRLRSVIRNAVKKYGIEEINDRVIDIVRDTVLGEKGEEDRKGFFFKENGMKVSDVEVLGIGIGDHRISDLLVNSQHQVVQETPENAKRKRSLEITRSIEKIKQETLDVQSVTTEKENELKIKELQKEKEILEQETENEVTEQSLKDKISDSELARDKKEKDQHLNYEKTRHEIETEFFAKKMEAITPQLIEAIKTAGNTQLANTLAQNLPQAGGSLGLLLGKGTLESLMAMVKGTPIEDSLKDLTNGAVKAPVEKNRISAHQEEDA